MRAGGVPSCEAGCVGGVSHLAGEKCGRSIHPNPHFRLPTPGGAFCVRGSALHGPDFVTVHTAHPSQIAFVTFTLRDPTGALPVGIRGSVVIHPGTVPGCVVPCSHRTVYHCGGAQPAGSLPWNLKIAEATLTDLAAVESGAPAGPFLGLEAATWAALRASPCAWARYAPTLMGHTHRVKASTGTAVATLPLRQLAARPTRPCAHFGEGGAVRCLRCGSTYASVAEYHSTCAPDHAPPSAII